jgi:nicotinamidase/pyrazinamidase
MKRRDLLGFTAGVSALSLMSARAWTAAKLGVGEGDVFVVVDVQNCFVPGGSLAVKGGDEIVPLVNRLAGRFRHVVLTQDWHTSDHVSFASQHPGKKPFDTLALPYGTQVLWPDHCVQGTEGALLYQGLDIPHAELVIRKGNRREVDSYSAFVEADRKLDRPRRLSQAARPEARVLRRPRDRLRVAWSALDARARGIRGAVVRRSAASIRGLLLKRGRT